MIHNCKDAIVAHFLLKEHIDNNLHVMEIYLCLTTSNKWQKSYLCICIFSVSFYFIINILVAINKSFELDISTNIIGIT